MIKALDNSGWGFDSKCFVCEPSNRDGLQIPFSHDTDEGLVFAEFQLGEAFSGAPNYLHGGLIVAVLDEAMAWAAIAVAGVFAVTKTSTTSFERPVHLHRPYRVEARVDGRDEDGIRTSSTITSRTSGKVSATSTALFVPLDADRAAAAIGVEVAGSDRDYLQG